jgi:hypothetical protein
MVISPVNTIISQDNITLSQDTTITVEFLYLPTDGTLAVDLLPLAPLLEELEMPSLLPPPLLVDSMDSMVESSLADLDVALEAEDLEK